MIAMIVFSLKPALTNLITEALVSGASEGCWALAITTNDKSTNINDNVLRKLPSIVIYLPPEFAGAAAGVAADFFVRAVLLLYR